MRYQRHLNIRLITTLVRTLIEPYSNGDASLRGFNLLQDGRHLRYAGLKFSSLTRLASSDSPPLQTYLFFRLTSSSDLPLLQTYLFFRLTSSSDLPPLQTYLLFRFTSSSDLPPLHTRLLFLESADGKSKKLEYTVALLHGHRPHAQPSPSCTAIVLMRGVSLMCGPYFRHDRFRYPK